MQKLVTRLHLQIEKMEEEDQAFTKVTKQKFAMLLTDSHELRYIDKVMKQRGDENYKRIAEEANYKYGIDKGEPILRRPGVERILKRGVGYL